jgi:hypothetical protein
LEIVSFYRRRQNARQATWYSNKTTNILQIIAFFLVRYGSLDIAAIVRISTMHQQERRTAAEEVAKTQENKS